MADLPYVVPSVEAHAIEMAPFLRSSDKAEIAAYTGQYPESALLRGLEGDVCMTIMSPEGTPIGMYGVAPSRFPDAGLVWMLATDEIARYALPFLKASREYMDPLHDIYPLLHNCVDARNTLHIRWLKWIGCTFVGTRIMGVQNRPFHEFVRLKSKRIR